jgi:hypothetical protein
MQRELYKCVDVMEQSNRSCAYRSNLTEAVCVDVTGKSNRISGLMEWDNLRGSVYVDITGRCNGGSVY